MLYSMSSRKLRSKGLNRRCKRYGESRIRKYVYVINVSVLIYELIHMLLLKKAVVIVLIMV